LSELDAVQRNHLQFLGISNVFRLAQPEFTERLVRALYSRLRNVYNQALADIEHWSKSVGAQLDTQLRERRRNFTRRIEAIDRIQNAAGSLEERIEELQAQEQAVDALQTKLAELTSHLILGEAPTVATVDLAIF
jgi:ATP-dependent helicase/DNAse subunit B